MKKRGIILFGVLILFLATEIFLRILGFKSGTFSNYFIPVDSIVYEPVHQGDSMGITHYNKDSKYLPDHYKVNQSGFLGDFDYSKKVVDSMRNANGSLVVMIIGDSYVEGCCVDSSSSSFVELLRNKRKDIIVLNFGVGSTDPLQYKLIAQSYIPQLKPDLVITCVYLGNDIMYYERVPHPYIPICYRTKNEGWLMSEPNFMIAEYKNQYFTSVEEAYDFRIRSFTILDKKRNYLEALISKSILLSKGYIYLKLGLRIIPHFRYLSFTPAYTANNLEDIQRCCANYGCKSLFTAIPSPEDVIRQKYIRNEYDFVFGNLNWSSPYINSFDISDYDGRSSTSHFNKSGHRKYFDFLNNEIDKILPPALEN